MRSDVRFLAVAIVALALCAGPAAAESFYNQGVDAYRSKDYPAARLHWSKAAGEGDASAMNNLGFLLFEGLGGNPDLAQAVALWRRAAVLGHSEAKWHLGDAYERGKGVEADATQAYAWYRCAFASAHAAPRSDQAEAEVARNAAASLTRLLGRLPPEKFAAAERLAKECVANHVR